MFTTSWLFDVLPRALGTDQPTLLNSESDEVVFHTVTFPLAQHAPREEIVRRLAELPALRQVTPNFWNWIDRSSSRSGLTSHAKGMTRNVTMEDDAVVLGNVELKGQTVVLSVNSATRATRGQTMLATALAGLVAKPLTAIQTVEQMQAAPRPSVEHATADIPPEARAELIHAELDQQYRALLDEPVPMLGNVSPRAAAHSAQGRRNLAAWPKHLENRSRTASTPSDPMATYDFSWMWRELKIEQLRS